MKWFRLSVIPAIVLLVILEGSVTGACCGHTPANGKQEYDWP